MFNKKFDHEVGTFPQSRIALLFHLICWKSYNKSDYKNLEIQQNTANLKVLRQLDWPKILAFNFKLKAIFKLNF